MTKQYKKLSFSKEFLSRIKEVIPPKIVLKPAKFPAFISIIVIIFGCLIHSVPISTCPNPGLNFEKRNVPFKIFQTFIYSFHIITK